LTKNNFKKVNFYKKFILLLKILMTVWTDSNYVLFIHSIQWIVVSQNKILQ